MSEMAFSTSQEEGHLHSANSCFVKYITRSPSTTTVAKKGRSAAGRLSFCLHAMERGPLFNPIRQRSEFGELHQAAIVCQQHFLAHRQQVDAALPPSSRH